MVFNSHKFCFIDLFILSPYVQIQKTKVLRKFRITLTNANPDYNGSLTLPVSICEEHDLHARQLVHIRVGGTGQELRTYVITTDTKDVCMNGAAARLVRPGDDIIVSSYHLNGFVECVKGKVHRARTVDLSFECQEDLCGYLHMDESWTAKTGITNGQMVSLVNIRNGKGDIVPIRAASQRVCQVCIRGYDRNDLIIVMSYSWVKLEDLRKGRVPEMRAYIPE